MIYEAEYDVGSQIQKNCFVNGDYRMMSNAKVGYYLGREQNQAGEKQEQGKDDDFEEWLL